MRKTLLLLPLALLGIVIWFVRGDRDTPVPGTGRPDVGEEVQAPPMEGVTGNPGEERSAGTPCRRARTPWSSLP